MSNKADSNKDVSNPVQNTPKSLRNFKKNDTTETFSTGNDEPAVTNEIEKPESSVDECQNSDHSDNVDHSDHIGDHADLSENDTDSKMEINAKSLIVDEPMSVLQSENEIDVHKPARRKRNNEREREYKRRSRQNCRIHDPRKWEILKEKDRNRKRLKKQSN